MTLETLTNSKIAAEDIPQLGQTPAQFYNKEVNGKEVIRNGESFYKISNADLMRPFFMSIVSNSDHWMFISSNGSLSAGRKNSNYALFPYYTDDKITEAIETTGSKSIFLVSVNNTKYIWEPFSKRHEGIYKVSRNLYKNVLGNKVVFEEINHDLNVGFTYEWNSSDKYGFVRKSCFTNQSDTPISVQLIDGVQNLLPQGVEPDLQNASSNLVDAYKKCELEQDTGLGIYSLSAIIVDKAEPSEALKANVVWSIGLGQSKKLISSLQLDNFRKGESVSQEIDIKAEKGAYFLNDTIALAAGATEEWMLIANVNQSISDIMSIKANIKSNTSMLEEVNADIQAGSAHLRALVGAADGLQMTNDRPVSYTHLRAHET